MMHSRPMNLKDLKRTILVVEDNELNREMLCAFLSDDFNIIKAENGQVGLELLEQNYEELSLVLLDVYMPVCDGFEFLRRKGTDERFAAVPVIVTTASDAVEDEIKCLKLGANDFVLKPYNVEIIMNRINNTIRLRESASIVNQLTWDDVTDLYTREFFYRRVESVFRAFPDKDFDMVCCDVEKYKSLGIPYPMEDFEGYEREEWEPDFHRFLDLLCGMGINAVTGMNQKLPSVRKGAPSSTSDGDGGR
jgi:PleD family two-component response regulator